MLIKQVFHELGWADELGSGIKNLVKYTKIYSGKEPSFYEEDIFKLIIPFSNITDNMDLENNIIELIKEDKHISITENANRLNLTKRTI